MEEGRAPLRKIIHLDMDAFYASVEQRDDSTLRGRPVVVAWRGQRSVVCAASYEARKFGVRSAMPAVRAERLCPEAVFVPPDFVRYRAASRAVREILARHSDLIEPLSLDEAYIDVSINKTDLPTATKVAQAMRTAIREELHLTASAGIAPNKFLAKIVSLSCSFRSTTAALDSLQTSKPLVHEGSVPISSEHGEGRLCLRRLLSVRTH